MSRTRGRRTSPLSPADTRQPSPGHQPMRCAGGDWLSGLGRLEPQHHAPWGPSRRGQPRPCRGQAQEFHKRAHSTPWLHVRQQPTLAATPHADEHVEVERPLEPLCRVHSRRLLLHRLLAGRCLKPRACLLRTCLRDPKWPQFGAWSEDAVEPREVCPRRRHQGCQATQQRKPGEEQVRGARPAAGASCGR